MDAVVINAIYWLIYLLLQSGLGFVMVHRKVPQSIVWLFPPLSVLFAHLLFIQANPAIRMIALIVPLLHAMKIVVANIHPKGKLSLKQWLIYYFLTVNMNPAIFTNPNQQKADLKILGGAILHLLLGCGIIAYLRFFTSYESLQASVYSFWGYSLLALFSLSVVLHFGLLPLNTFILKLLGIADYPVFKQPFKSKSIAEFWGRRWNLAFSEMTATAMFKPLVRKVGAKWAGFLSFMLSGLLHEIAISLSVQKGYGLPMLFFLIHGLLMLVEKRLFNKSKSQRNKPGTWWVVASLVLPLPLLFHPAFVNEVVWYLIWLEK